MMSPWYRDRWNAADQLITPAHQSGKGPAFHVEVEIYEEIIARIQALLYDSPIEEGGKFVGTVREITGSSYMDRSGVKFLVESYIDSGPQVSNSVGHLEPDGPYQEAVFRLLEYWVPDIEHIGSWHSHHCNGLGELSSGDIGGYFRSVNNQNYNLNYFLSYLVTRVSRDKIDGRFFIFVRGHSNFYEVPDEAVYTLRGVSPLDKILSAAESLSLLKRVTAINKSRNDILVPFVSNSDVKDFDDFMKQVRLQDQKWIKTNWPDAVLVQDKQTKALAWEWHFRCGDDEVTARYSYPAKKPRLAGAKGRLTLSIEGKTLERTVPLDDQREEKVIGFVELFLSRTTGGVQDTVDGADGRSRK